jgi:hypothetical protein
MNRQKQLMQEKRLASIRQRRQSKSHYSFLFTLKYAYFIAFRC